MNKILVVAFLTNALVMLGQKSNESEKFDNTIAHDAVSGIYIDGNNNSVKITTTIIYNAIPDGYHVTYIKSFIGKTLDEVESTMNSSTEKLATEVKKSAISNENALVEIISLDPIFDLQMAEVNKETPSGYKITENITFNVKNILKVRELEKKCLEHKVFDSVSVHAYLNNSTPVYDSLAMKAIEFHNKKKKLCEAIGWSFTDGKPSFSKNSEVIYPNEKYLKGYINQQGIWKNHLQENSSLTYTRTINTDSYFNLNLKDADFVFNAKVTSPVIQFHYQITYGFIKRDREKEKEDLDREKDKNAREKSFYILGKDGELKKVDMQK